MFDLLQVVTYLPNLNMSSDTLDSKESRYISAVTEDLFGDKYHIKCDQEVLKSLEEDAIKSWPILKARMII